MSIQPIATTPRAKPTISMTEKCKFETEFATVYQRNNKAKSKGKEGMKNIRCFPNHGKAGHVEKGFCGSTVSFVVKSKVSDKPIKAWGQFELADGSNQSCKIGDVLSAKYIADQLERNRVELSKPWFPSFQNRVDDKSIRFIMNSERWGWNYAWVSNVHTCDLTHCLTIYLFEVLDQDRLVCVDVLKSSEFQVFCSRRRRNPSSPMSSSSIASSNSSPLTITNEKEEAGKSSMETQHGSYSNKLPLVPITLTRISETATQSSITASSTKPTRLLPAKKRLRQSTGCGTDSTWRDPELVAANLLLFVRNTIG
jgi:hypothetical protein